MSSEPAAKRRRSEHQAMSASEVVSEIRALIAAGKTDAEIYAFIKQPLIGKPAPDFNVAESLLPSKEFANIGLDTFKGQWKVLLWYPLDFTFVCPTEIIAYGDRAEDFTAINTQVIAASCDSKFSHLAWVNTPRSEGGLGSMKIPILADFEKKVATSYGVVIPSGDDAGVTLRGLFIIDPNNVIRQVTINDLPVGRNVDETIRLIKAFQFVEKHGEVCPANWQPGAATMSADPEKSKAYFSKVANN